MGQGLLTSEGDFWLRQRRLAQPAFHKEKLISITRDISGIADAYVARWETYQQQGQTFDVALEMNRLTLEVVTQALFSTSIGDKLDQIHEPITFLNDYGIRAMTNPIIILGQLLTPKPLRKFQRAINQIDAVMYEIIEGRIASGVSHEDLLGMLLESEDADTGEKMNKKQLRDEAITMFMAGHETSANALAWTWYLLTQHPDVRSRLHQEWEQVLGGKTATFTDLPRLTFTRMVIQEAMRLYPPAWMVGRRPKEEDVVAGFRIPAQTNILMTIYEIHRHPDWWEEPEAFIPDRFAPEKVNKMHKFQYFPFGGGPRMCIGYHFAMMEMQIILATLGQRFDLELAQAHAPKMEPLITLRPKSGIHMRISGIHSPARTVVDTLT